MHLAAFTLLYFLAGKLGLALASIHPSASAVWPPTGIALAAALLFGLRVWPAILLGAFLVNITTAGSIATSAGIAAGNTLEALIGARLVNRFAAGIDAFQRPQSVLRFALVIALAATVSASVGLLSLYAGGYAEAARAPGVWFTWWIGDTVGALVFTPFILVWARARKDAVTGSPVEAVALGLAIAGVTGLVFSYREPVGYALLPLVVWASVRFGRRGAATAALAISAIALWGTVQGLGPFATDSPNRPLLYLEVFVGSVMLTSLVLAAAIRGREQAEAALRRSYEELEGQVRKRTASLGDAIRDVERSRSVLNEAQRVAHIGSWEWDILADRVTWSDELYRIYGLEPGSIEVTYQAYMERVHPEDREQTAASVGAALEGEEGFEFEERIVRPDGEVRVIQSKGYVVRDESGLPQRMIGTCHDITERKRVEIELGERMQALDRSNAELSMLSYAASHDLKEPLRTVASNVQLIEQRLRGTGAPEIERSARFAVEGVRRMDELITDLLAYSNAERPSNGVVDANRALAEARARLATTIAETGARIESGPLPRVVAGPARLAGLFQNLISNAIKYRHDGRVPEIRISAERHGALWRFVVADNGRGFDPSQAERAFVLFERLHPDPAIPGTGMGLAICRRIVESQGGRIWAESEKGRGSVFRFTLPADGPGPESPSASGV